MKRNALLVTALSLITLPAMAQSFLDQSSTLLQDTAKQKVLDSAGVPATTTTPALPTASSLKSAATSQLTGQLPTGSLSLATIKQKLIEAGYSKITGLTPSPSGTSLTATALNATGTPTNLQVNPLTGAILSAVAK